MKEISINNAYEIKLRLGFIAFATVSYPTITYP